MRVKIHVQGIKGSGAVKDGEEAAALLHGVLEVDGHLLDEVGEIEVVFSGGTFVNVKPHLIPGSFEVVMHTDESWPELLSRINADTQARTGSGQLLAEAESG